jgi:flagellar hook protein FlgE
MLKSLNSGLSGVQQFQHKIDNIGNNIANVNTLGFKGSRLDFADSMGQAIQAQGSGSAQVGSGVTTSTVRSSFSQGTGTQTFGDHDFMIQGKGFFQVVDPNTNERFATRAGNFTEGDNGFLVTPNGQRVLGYQAGDAGAIGPIQISDDPALRPADIDANAEVVGHTIDSDGKVWINLTGNQRYVRSQILLQDYRDPDALTKLGNNLYGNLEQAGPTSDNLQAPGSLGLGTIQSGWLEMSNVDLTNEFTQLITSQRSFQASARMISTSDELLQEIVGLKR